MTEEAMLSAHCASTSMTEDDFDDFCIKIIDNETGDVSIITGRDLSDDCIILDEDEPEEEEPECTVSSKPLLFSSALIDGKSKAQIPREPYAADIGHSAIVAPTSIYRNVAVQKSRLPAKVHYDLKRNTFKSFHQVYRCTRCRVEFKEQSERDQHETACMFDRPSFYQCDEYYTLSIPTEDRPTFLSAIDLTPNASASDAISASFRISSNVFQDYNNITARNIKTNSNSSVSFISIVTKSDSSNDSSNAYHSAIVTAADSVELFKTDTILAECSEVKQNDAITTEAAVETTKDKHLYSDSITPSGNNADTIQSACRKLFKSSDIAICDTISNRTEELNKSGNLNKVHIDAIISDDSNSSGSLASLDSSNIKPAGELDNHMLQTPRRMLLSRCSLTAIEQTTNADNGVTTRNKSEQIKLKMFGSKSLLSIALSSELGRRVYKHTVAQLKRTMNQDSIGKSYSKLKAERNKRAAVTSMLKTLNNDDKRHIALLEDVFENGLERDGIVGNEDVRKEKVNKENCDLSKQCEVNEMFVNDPTNVIKENTISLCACDTVVTNDPAIDAASEDSNISMEDYCRSARSVINTLAEESFTSTCSEMMPCLQQKVLEESCSYADSEEKKFVDCGNNLLVGFHFKMNQKSCKPIVDAASQENESKISEYNIDSEMIECKKYADCNSTETNYETEKLLNFNSVNASSEQSLCNINDRYADKINDNNHLSNLDEKIVDTIVKFELLYSENENNEQISEAMLCDTPANTSRLCDKAGSDLQFCDTSVNDSKTCDTSVYDSKLCDAAANDSKLCDHAVNDLKLCDTVANVNNAESIGASFDACDNGNREMASIEAWIPPSYEKYCRSRDKCIFSYRQSRCENKSLPFRECRRYKLDTAGNFALDSSVYSTESEYCHLYKFTKIERQTFCKAICRGLNLRSYQLKQSLIPCHADLQKLTEKEIRNWKSSTRLRLDDRRFRISQLRKAEQQHIESEYILATTSKVKQNVCDARTSNIKQSVKADSKCRKLQFKIRFKKSEQVKKSEQKQDMSNNKHTKERRKRAVKDMESQSSVAEKLKRKRAKKDDKKTDKKSGIKLKIKKIKSKNNDSSHQVIAISSDEDDDVMCVSVGRNNGLALASGATSTPVTLMLRCHVCNAEITCSTASRDRIKEHYRIKHNIHNVDLIQSKDHNGREILTIVQSESSVKSSPNSSKTVSSSKPSKRQNRVSESAAKMKSSPGKQTSNPLVSRQLFDHQTSKPKSNLPVNALDNCNNSLLSNITTILLSMQNASNTTSNTIAERQKPVKLSNRTQSSNSVKPYQSSSKNSSQSGPFSFGSVPSRNMPISDNFVFLQSNSSDAVVRRNSVTAMESEIICLD